MYIHSYLFYKSDSVKDSKWSSFRCLIYIMETIWGLVGYGDRIFILCELSFKISSYNPGSHIA